MGVERTGNLTVIGDYGASGSQSITVPADAEIMIVGACRYGATLSTATLTIGGQAVSFVRADTILEAESTAIFVKSNPLTGSQTFSWNVGSGTAYAGVFYVAFYKGGSTIRLSDGESEVTDGNATTGSMASQAGDGGFAVTLADSGATVGWTNAVELDESQYNQVVESCAEFFPTGAHSITATESGGETGVLALTAVVVAAGGVDVTATLDELVLTEYNPTVNKKVSFTATLDELVLTEYNPTVDLGISFTAGLDELILTEYNPVVNKKISFTAGLDELILTEYNPTINKKVSFTATLDELVLTEYNPVVNKKISFTATLDELVLTEYNPTVNKKISFTATLDELVLTEYNPTAGLGISVTAGLDELILTEFNSTVNKKISFTAGLDELILTEYNPAVNLIINVTAGVDALILTEYNPTVNKKVSFTAGLDELILTEYNPTANLGSVTSVRNRGLLLLGMGN